MLRIFGSVIGGTICALGCFLFAHSLISDFKKPDDGVSAQVRLEFIRTVPEQVINVKERRLPDKAPPVERPPPVAATMARPQQDVAELPVQIEMPEIDVPVATGYGPYLGEFKPGQPVADGDLIPLVQVSPRYPSYAEARNIEGWVNLEFTIRADGSVADPVVLESQPPRIFDRSAIHAILRWKFKPRVVNGAAIDSRGQQLISFNLVDAS